MTERAVARLLDASALLAFLFEEPGGAAVLELMSDAAVTSVNWSEVVQKAGTRGARVDGLREDLAELGMRVLAFDADDAERAAALWSATQQHGLSLADRACLAVARRIGVPAVTADRAWRDAGLDVVVHVIR